MTILNHYVSPARRITALTVTCCSIGFVSGFLLSLALAAYSLYACIEMR